MVQTLLAAFIFFNALVLPVRATGHFKQLVTTDNCADGSPSAIEATAFSVNKISEDAAFKNQFMIGGRTNSLKEIQG